MVPQAAREKGHPVNPQPTQEGKLGTPNLPRSTPWTPSSPRRSTLWTSNLPGKRGNPLDPQAAWEKEHPGDPKSAQEKGHPGAPNLPGSGAPPRPPSPMGHPSPPRCPALRPPCFHIFIRKKPQTEPKVPLWLPALPLAVGCRGGPAGRVRARGGGTALFGWCPRGLGVPPLHPHAGGGLWLEGTPTAAP